MIALISQGLLTNLYFLIKLLTNISAGILSSHNFLATTFLALAAAHISLNTFGNSSPCDIPSCLLTVSTVLIASPMLLTNVTSLLTNLDILSLVSLEC